MQTEEQLSTPQPMPNVFRVLAIASDVENCQDIYNSGTTYQVQPITAPAPKDSLAATKSQASVRHYEHEYSLPEGWSVWKWEEFDGFDFSPKYQVRNAEGHVVPAERVYRLAVGSEV